MNQINRALLSASAWLAGLLGADSAQFGAILETKLTLDSRRPMIGLANRRERETGGAFRGALIFYALIGCLMGGIVWRVGSPLVGMTLVHTVVLLMLTMTLIGDFTNVLLDTTDNAVLQPRPVSGRTLFLARTAHIAVYLGLLGLSLSLVSIAIGTIRWSYWFPLVYLVTLAGCVMLAICGASLFYLIALRSIGRERVRDVVLYIQILFTVFIFGGYQFLPRLVDMAHLERVRIADQRWIYFYPPAWLAGPLDLLAQGTGIREQGTGNGGLTPDLVLTAMAFTLPPLFLLLITRGLATRFTQMLAAMEVGSAVRTVRREPFRPHSGPCRLFPVPCSLIPAFEFFWTILGRDRLFKQRVYPSIVMLFILPVALLFSEGNPRAALQSLPATNRHLFLLYLACASFAPAILQLRYSPFWQAAWIYEALPIPRGGDILLPALLAVLLRFVLPGFAFLSAVLLAIWGVRILPDIALALLVTIAVALVEGMLLGRCVPFSEQFGVREGSGRMGKNLFLLAIAAGLGWGHYCLRGWTWGVPVAIALMAVLIIILGAAYRRTPWPKVAALPA
jgi:hypothetical protein